MNTPDPLAEIAACNDQALNTLTRSLTHSQGEFTLILARCNYTCLRSQILHLLHQRCSLNLFELTLDSSAQTIYTAIHNQLGNQQPDAVLVTGLELVTDLDNLLIATNRVRDLFRQFPFPVVFWVTNQVCKRLIKVAMDLYNWSSPKLEFVLPEPALMALVAETANQALADEDNLTLDDAELQAIQQSYSDQGQNFPPEFHAILCLSLGIIHTRNNHIDAAIPYYQQSLTLWQEHQSGEQMGITSLHLAWAYALKGEQYQAEIRDYVQQAWQHLHQERCTDSLVHHSCKLGDLLRQVGDWEKLQHLAEKVLTWHQQQGDVQKIAQDYGFLADVALNQRQWRDAQKFAKQGIKAWQQVSEFEIKRLGLCYFILAQSQQQLGQEKDAIATLATAREISLNATITLHQYDPKLYVNILQNLRTLKFEQGDYLDAFHLKLEQRQIETQYGLRAFIGAGRLHPPRQVIQPGIRGRQGLSLSQIVASSGRQRDVEELLERIRRRDRKLTVIYGSSGVGKSSILQAGLVPILQQTYFEGRDIVPVLLQVYKDWVGGLDKGLVQALKQVNRFSISAKDSLETQSDPPPAPLFKGGAKRGSSIDLIGDNKRSSDSPLPLQGRGAGGVRSTLSTILNQLRQNEHSQLLTVLIFDQFEEFFFDHKDPASRREFYEFLRQCVEIPYVKVILSLREDYIYYLLELNRTTPLTNIDKNHEHILYYLGNFSAADAKSVIQSLTARSHLPFESDLVDQLVQDLAKDLGEVRPIELQIVGYQLETEKMTTRDDYRKYESKEELVEAFLADVVQDCGKENEQVAQLVLYLLTDENNNRPLKTKAELRGDLDSDEKKLNLVLEILEGSGLVFRMPVVLDDHYQDDHYQLVHDYFVSFIRQKYQPQSLELELTKAQLKEALRQEKQQRNRATIAEIKALNSLSKALLLSHDQLGALVASVKAGRKLKETEVSQDIKIQTVGGLHQAVYGGVRERNRFHGHVDSVFCMSFSPDGQMIASGGKDTTIKLWSIDGTLLNTLQGHKSDIVAITFSPNGELLASASCDKTIKLWSLDGTLINTLKGHKNYVLALSFSPDGKLLASASRDKTIKLWNRDGTLLHTIQGHNHWVLDVKFSPDGKTIASASVDKTVKFWSCDGTLLQSLQKHKNRVLAVSFSPNAQRLTSASLDKTYVPWELDSTSAKTYRCGMTYTYRSAGVKAVSFSPDGKLLASASRDNTVLLFGLEDSDDGYSIWHGNGILGMSFSPDSTLLASANYDGTVRLWGNQPPTYLKHSDYGVDAVCFSPDGKIIASASAYSEKTIKLWNRDGRLLKTIQGHDAGIYGVSFSPDGKMIASASGDRTIKLWKQDGKLFKTLQGHSERVYGVSFSPDGKMIASASGDGTIKLWRQDGRLLKTLQGHSESVNSVSFSPDGKMIASASGDGTIKLWNSNGTLLTTLQEHNNQVLAVSFSPDNQMLASASWDKTVKLWSRDGTLIKTLEGHNYGVKSVSFSPDGKTLASGSSDYTIKLWNLNGTELKTLWGHKYGVNSVTFSPDGKTLASASMDGRVILWNFDLDDLLIRGCNWLRDYLRTNPNISEEDRHLCDDIGTQE
ncbi:MAG: AAA family ATPase [Coleofasciculus chthonoplastes F3-SA18-01]|uniref:WD40 domain-containing protein n=1 Tax=Coleofasciculus chthonoplastes TaxID=64178 RepID=UPI0032F12D9B